MTVRRTALLYPGALQRHLTQRRSITEELAL